MGSVKDRHPMYNSWAGMKQRCKDTNADNYKNYGGRGIKVCDRWLESFENFRDDMLPSWKQGLQLDRIDVNGNYDPNNCRWATPSENAKNRRNKASVQSQYLGVAWSKKTKSWRIQVEKQGFTSEEEANNVASKLRDYLKSIT